MPRLLLISKLFVLVKCLYVFARPGSPHLVIKLHMVRDLCFSCLVLLQLKTELLSH